MVYVTYQTTLNGSAWRFKHVTNEPYETYYVDEYHPLMIIGISMIYEKDASYYTGDFLGVDIDDRRRLFQDGIKAI